MASPSAQLSRSQGLCSVEMIVNHKSSGAGNVSPQTPHRRGPWVSRPPDIQNSNIWCRFFWSGIRFLFRILVSSRFLEVCNWLFISSSLSSRQFYISFHLSFSNVFYKAVPTQMWPIQFAFLLSVVLYCVPLLDYVLLFHFLHDRSNWSSPSFFSTAFQKLSGFSDLHFEV